MPSSVRFPHPDVRRSEHAWTRPWSLQHGAGQPRRRTAAAAAAAAYTSGVYAQTTKGCLDLEHTSTWNRRVTWCITELLKFRVVHTRSAFSCIPHIPSRFLSASCGGARRAPGIRDGRDGNQHGAAAGHKFAPRRSGRSHGRRVPMVFIFFFFRMGQRCPDYINRTATEALFSPPLLRCELLVTASCASYSLPSSCRTCTRT